MSLQVGELYAKLVLDKTKYEGDLKHAETSTKGFGSKTKAAFAGAAKAIVASLAIIGATLIIIGEKSIESAEVQERATLKVKAAFGKASDAVIKWAEKEATVFGFHDDMLENAVSSYQLWAKNVGKSTKAATADGQELAKRAEEIASATGQSFEDVFGKLLKGEQGATKGLKGFGVAVSTAAIKQEALKLGLYSGKGALDDTAKAAALHSLIMKQTAKYTGLAADSQDLLATKTRKMGEIMDRVMDTIGVAFITVVSAVVDVLMPVFQQFSDWVTENMPAIQKIFDEVMSFIADSFATAQTALQPFIDALSTVIGAIVGFLQEGDNMTYFLEALGLIVAVAIVPPFLAWAAATIIALAPILLLVAAVTLVIKVLSDLGILQPLIAEATKLLGEAFDWVTTNVLPALSAAFQWIIDNVLPALGDAFNWIVTNILPPVMSIIGTITDVILPALGEAFNAVVSWVRDNLPTISKIFGQVFAAVQTIVGNIADVVKTAFEIIANVIKTVAPIIVDIGRTVFPYIGAAATILLNVIGGVFDAIGNIWNTAWSVAKAVAKGIGDAWNGLVGVFNTVSSAIAGVVKTTFNTVIGIINAIITAIDSIQVHIGKIGMDTPAGFVGVGPFDWNGVNIPKLSYLAKGLWNVPTPMPAMLHAGEAVLPATAAADYRKGRTSFGDQQGSGGSPLIGEQHIYGMQPGDVERETSRALRRAALQWKLEGRA